MEHLRALALVHFSFIYANDFPFVLERSKVTAYADDMSISYSSKPTTCMIQVTNADLDSICLWLEGDKFL